MTNISDVLGKTKDRSLVQKWGLWLVKKDADLGLKVSRRFFVAKLRTDIDMWSDLDFKGYKPKFNGG